MWESDNRKERKKVVKSGIASGVIALIFFVLGIQSTILMVKIGDDGSGSVKLIDTIYIQTESKNEYSNRTNLKGRSDYINPNSRSYGSKGQYNSSSKRKEVGEFQNSLFKFDPNIVTESELIRLGFSLKQAKSIIQYREKGNKFYCKEDFARLYAVSDSMMNRLDKFIVVKQLDINLADSADFTTLRGIGGYYAAKIVDYREQLGSFAKIDQLMEIRGIDNERFDQFKNSITIDNQHIKRFSIWEASDSFLINHPYIGSLFADRIIKYKELCDSSEWRLEKLCLNNIIPENSIEKIKLYSSSAELAP